MAAISDSDDDIPPYSDLSSVSSDSSDRIRGNVFQKALYRVDRARGKTEDFLNDIHESYSFDLDPEYRLKLQKRFDGWGVGAKFDFKSGDCRVKVKSAPRRGGEDGFRFWRWFKKVEVQPEDGDVEAQFQLGECYAKGWGIAPNRAAAREWYRRAAEHGHVESAYRLSHMLRSLGADEVIDYTQEDFTQLGVRYDIIFDIPGNRPFSAFRLALKPDGRYVPIGHEHYGASRKRVFGLIPHFLEPFCHSTFFHGIAQSGHRDNLSHLTCCYNLCSRKG